MLAAFSSIFPALPNTVTVRKAKPSHCCRDCGLAMEGHKKHTNGLTRCPSEVDMDEDEEEAQGSGGVVAQVDSDEEASVASGPPSSVSASVGSGSSTRTVRGGRQSSRPVGQSHERPAQLQSHGSYETVTTIPNSSRNGDGSHTVPATPARSFVTVPTVPNTPQNPSTSGVHRSNSSDTISTVPNSDPGTDRPWKPAQPYYPEPSLFQNAPQHRQRQLYYMHNHGPQRSACNDTNSTADSNKENSPPVQWLSDRTSMSSDREEDRPRDVARDHWLRAMQISGARGAASLYQASHVYMEHLRETAQALKMRTGTIPADLIFQDDLPDQQKSTLVAGVDGVTVDRIMDMYHATARGYQNVALRKLEEVEPVSSATLLAAGVIGGVVLLVSLSLLA